MTITNDQFIRPLPMHRLKAEPGDGRSREPAGEMTSWKSEQQPVAWIEWINDMGVPVRYMAQDIR